MALRYLLDEHFRGDLWRAILDHNARSSSPIDAVRVGDLPDLQLSTPDSDIRRWAEHAGCVLVSRDRRTMIAELAAPFMMPQRSVEEAQSVDRSGGRRPVSQG